MACALLLLGVAASRVTAARAANDASAGDAAPPQIEVFSRADCPHCREADAWLRELVARRPEVRVVRHDVLADAAALERLLALCERAGVHPPAVPAFWIGGVLRVGFAEAATTGRELEALLDRGPPRDGQATGPAAPPAPDDARGRPEAPAARARPGEPDASVRPDAPAARVRLPWLGEIALADVGLPLFTIAVGLLDGFNPCAMWVLLLLLALLAPMRDRRRMAVVGGTFLAASGLVYLAFLAAWLEVFRFIGLSRSLQVGLGLVAVAIGLVNLRDAARGGGEKTLGIPDAAKPGIYARMRRIVRAENLPAAALAAALLAFVVNFVELLCSAGFPALYTHVLSTQPLGRAAHLGYLLLYVTCYVLDDAAVLTLALATLGARRLGTRGSRVLTAVSGVVMLALGLVLALRPGWLAALGGPVAAAAGDG